MPKLITQPRQTKDAAAAKTVCIPMLLSGPNGIYGLSWKPRGNRIERSLGIGSPTLLQLLIPDFYYLPASVFSESSGGYVSWRMWPSGRLDEGRFNRPATNFLGIHVNPNRVGHPVERSTLSRLSRKKRDIFTRRFNVGEPYAAPVLYPLSGSVLLLFWHGYLAAR